MNTVGICNKKKCWNKQNYQFQAKLYQEYGKTKQRQQINKLYHLKVLQFKSKISKQKILSKKMNKKFTIEIENIEILQINPTIHRTQ